MIGTVFIGLERSMMDFFGKDHHLGIIFPASPNNVRLTSSGSWPGSGPDPKNNLGHDQKFYKIL